MSKANDYLRTRPHSEYLLRCERGRESIPVDPPSHKNLCMTKKDSNALISIVTFAVVIVLAAFALKFLGAMIGSFLGLILVVFAISFIWNLRKK